MADLPAFLIALPDVLTWQSIGPSAAMALIYIKMT
jgi:hypothetical protein